MAVNGAVRKPSGRTGDECWGKAVTIEFNGAAIATTASGYLENLDDWSEDLALHIAKLEGIEMSDAHWDVVRYLREEFAGNNEHQPSTREIVKAMAERWNRPVDQKQLYELFARDPSKQAGRIAGLPESRRKGGY
jgi:tRNA 2-thiouridine synthesizing protein E